jgi:hypothetical protein
MHKSGYPKSVPTSTEGLADWEPKHMARQLANGLWTSKCGQSEDITHFTLDALESYGWLHGSEGQYGCSVLCMRRFIVLSWLVRLAQFLYWKYEVISNKISVGSSSCPF